MCKVPDSNFHLCKTRALGILTAYSLRRLLKHLHSRVFLVLNIPFVFKLTNLFELYNFARSVSGPLSNIS